MRNDMEAIKARLDSLERRVDAVDVWRTTLHNYLEAANTTADSQKQHTDAVMRYAKDVNARVDALERIVNILVEMADNP